MQKTNSERSNFLILLLSFILILIICVLIISNVKADILSINSGGDTSSVNLCNPSVEGFFVGKIITQNQTNQSNQATYPIQLNNTNPNANITIKNQTNQTNQTQPQENVNSYIKKYGIVTLIIIILIILLVLAWAFDLFAIFKKIKDSDPLKIIK